MNVAEHELQTINGWVKQVDGRLDKLSEAVEQLKLNHLELKMLLTAITDGQKQYLTPQSFDHTKVVKDISELDDAVRDLKRISVERQCVIDKSEGYMRRVDEMEKSLARVWKTVTWVFAAIGTVGIGLAYKWAEMLLIGGRQ